ncbi:hypothetical protein [Streptomyces sp. BE303]|uniref:hypothetical protein n=1 Tax=Streptomyces sp. BE303 TaxID=3002528 RepID=UPI002E78F32F|nr:hypothetical protein [Streptomyces sp. BE303]MED7952523.1 hypothetical protein [Streptomyces sp. BE303]
MSSPPAARTPRPPRPSLRLRPRLPPRLPLLVLRATATALAVLAVVQTMLAASFLNGHYDSLKAHELAAMALDTLVLVQLVAAALVGLVARRGPGGTRGPFRPLGTAALLAVAAGAQTAFGYDRAVGLHVTLGVLLVSALLFALVGAWRLPLPASGGAPAAPQGAAAGRLPRPSGSMEVAQ